MSLGKAVQTSFVCSVVFIVVLLVSYSNWTRINYTMKQGTTRYVGVLTSYQGPGPRAYQPEPPKAGRYAGPLFSRPAKKAGLRVVGAQDLDTTNYSYTRKFINRCHVPPGRFRAWNEGVVTLFKPEVKVNCSRVISGDEKEINRSRLALLGWKNSLSDEVLMEKMENCSWLTDYFSYNLYNSKLEKSFPIAFTFVVHNSPQQVLRLLRLLYRPQNSYCIHCDVKSPHKAFFQKIVDCFENVITPSKVENVVWGQNTIMEAQMNCMTDLLALRTKQKHKWRYVINLCGKELPLKTNKEMVLQLMRINGTSSVMAHKISAGYLRNRIKGRVQNYINSVSSLLGSSFNENGFYKSLSYNAISFKFAKFLAFNATAKKFREFFKQFYNSEEHFYATMYMLPGVPGGYNASIPPDHYFNIEAPFWIHEQPCAGLAIHSVCIITAIDLSKVMVHHKNSNHFFHNKYFMEVDHTVMTCMEERIVAKNKMEYYEEECM